jgi:hypothetical protein
MFGRIELDRDGSYELERRSPFRPVRIRALRNAWNTISTTTTFALRNHVARRLVPHSEATGGMRALPSHGSQTREGDRCVVLIEM